MCVCVYVHVPVCVCVYVHDGSMHTHLILPLVLAQLLVHGPLAGEQVGGVATPEAGLDVEDGHVPPAGRVAVATRHVGAAGHAGLVLQQQEEGLHVRPQTGHEASAHHRHRLLITCQQSLQQSAVVPAGSHQAGVMSTQCSTREYRSCGGLCCYTGGREDIQLVLKGVCFGLWTGV